MITKRDIDFCEEVLGCKFTEWQRLCLMFCVPEKSYIKLYCSDYGTAITSIPSYMKFINRTQLLNATDDEKGENND